MASGEVTGQAGRWGPQATLWGPPGLLCGERGFSLSEERRGRWQQTKYCYMVEVLWTTQVPPPRTLRV